MKVKIPVAPVYEDGVDEGCVTGCWGSCDGETSRSLTKRLPLAQAYGSRAVIFCTAKPPLQIRHESPAARHDQRRPQLGNASPQA